MFGTLAWTQNMLTAPIGIGWMYFAMVMSLALIVPFGLVFFNLIATLVGGAARMRSPLLFAAGALSAISIGLSAGDLALDDRHRLAPSAHHRQHRRDPFRADRRRRLRRLRGAALVVPEDDRPRDGRDAWRASRSGRWRSGPCSPSCRCSSPAAFEGEVVDAYKFFGRTGVDAYNLVATIGSFVLAIGIVMTLVNAILSRNAGPEAGHDPWGGESLEWFALSPPDPHNFDLLPDVRSARPMRDIRDAIEHRTSRPEQPARESQPVA